jgi:ribosome recycling factor-like protein
VLKHKPIILPSFLRRSLKAYALKNMIRSTGCELSRVGRSRNWRLLASQQQLQDIILLVEESKEESWLWMIAFLKKHKAQISHKELLNLIKLNPDISINELLALSDCTIAQARKALDEMEGF